MVSFSLTALVAAASAIAVALPQSSEPLACTEPSNKFQAWSVSEFDFHWTQTFSTPAHSINAGYVSFNVTNPGVGHVSHCNGFSTVYPNWFNGEQWYDCEGSIVDSLKFKFNSDTKEITLNQAWLCDTTQFNKTGSATVDLQCRDTGVTKKDNWTMGEIYSSEAFNCDITNFNVWAQ